MKKLLLLAVSFLPTILFAQTVASVQDPFTVTAKLTNLKPPARAYLLYQLGVNKVIDSAELVDGRYIFTGKILYPENAFLVIDHQGVGFAKLNDSKQGDPAKALDILNFFLDKGIYYIDGSDSSATAKISGSKINSENTQLKLQLKPLDAPTAKLMADANAATPEQQGDPAFRGGINARAKVIQEQQISILKNFVADHPESFISINILNQLGPHSSNPAELSKLFDNLSADLKTSEPGKALKHSIDQAMVTGIGVVAPDFTQPDVDGKPVSLSSFRGKYVLVDFWASWCGPCRQENPNLVRTYNKYKDKNFTVLGVSLDRPDGKDAWLKAIKTDGLVWTQVSDLNYWSNKAAVLYFINQIPSNFLLDPNGKIIARDLRGEDLDNKLGAILGKM